MSTDSHTPAPVPRRGLAIASLVLGILGIPTFGCLIVGAVAGVVLGIVALLRANREPQLYGGKGLAIAGIATSALSLLLVIPIAIIAAIAIPSLLRARISANEASTIGDIRTVISAEAAYQSASGGDYAPMECLAQPAQCLPGYSGPPFLDAELASADVKNGYRRTFIAGLPTSVASSPPGGPFSARGLRNFAYAAVPETTGRTGMRGFCGDSTGRICFTTNGSAPLGQPGECETDCKDLR